MDTVEIELYTEALRAAGILDYREVPAEYDLQCVRSIRDRHSTGEDPHLLSNMLKAYFLTSSYKVLYVSPFYDFPPCGAD